MTKKTFLFAGNVVVGPFYECWFCKDNGLTLCCYQFVLLSCNQVAQAGEQV